MYAREGGFADELTLLFPRGKRHIGMSRRYGEEDADAHGGGIYPQVLKDVVEVVEGTPEVQAHEVSDSTFHKIAAYN
jgi:hypothetical protein